MRDEKQKAGQCCQPASNKQQEDDRNAASKMDNKQNDVKDGKRPMQPGKTSGPVAGYKPQASR